MSLMLRKDCQVLLDTAKLSTYHVEINHNKNLAIVGECGQPFINIGGVSFSKMAPTRAEIAYAVELLQEFLASHKKQIDEYIVAGSAFKKLVEPERKHKDFHINSSHGYGRRSASNWDVSYLDGIYKYRFDEKDELTGIEIQSKKKITIDKLESYKFDEAKHKKAMAFMLKIKAYSDEQQRVDNMKSELSSCHI